MTEFIFFDLDKAYQEIAEGARNEGIASQEAYDSFVQGYLDKKLSWGELHPDNDIERIAEDLKARWEIYKKNIQEM